MKNMYKHVIAIILLVGFNLCWYSTNAQTVHLLKDLVTDLEGTNPGGSYPDNFKTINGLMYFAGRDKTAGPNNGHHIYKTDGTEAGTQLVKILQTPVTIYGNLTNSFTDFNGKVLFVHSVGVHHYQLWQTDGTDAGTQILKDFSSAGFSTQGIPQSFTLIGNTMYFIANDGRGTELWKTDGTAVGTVEVTDLFPGTISGGIDPIGNKSLIALNGKVYFAALTSLLAADKGLYSFDGDTLVLVKSIPSGTINSLTVFNGHLYFEVKGNLWKSDGTNAGSALVQGVNNINSILVFNNELYAAGDVSLYKIDGLTNTIIATNTGSFVGANSDNFFTKFGFGSSAVYYKSNGTSSGTILVSKDIGESASFFVYNNKMYTGRFDSTSTFNLWETDGTDGGTKRYPTGQLNFGIVNNRAIFLRYETSVGIEPHYIELDATSGIVKGTQNSINAIYPNPSNSVLNIETNEIINIKIVNVWGVIVATQYLVKGINRVDVHNLSNGVYFIYNDKGPAVKFIKE